MEWWKVSVVSMVLTIQAIWDIRWKRVWTPLTISALVIGFIIIVIEGRQMTEVCLALIPGLICLWYSKISKEALGYGDSILLCVLGLYEPMENILRIAMSAFGLAGITSMILILFFHKGRKYEMAFIPFLFIAYVIEIGIRIKGQVG